MMFICNLSPSIKTYSCDWLVSAHRQCKANLKLRAVRKTNTLHMDIKIYMNAYTYLHSLCFGNVLVYVLACLKQWSYVKTQLPNDQIRSKLFIATRGNASKACILMLFKTIWNCREHFENNLSKTCILMLFKTIWNCREHFENNLSKACILTVLKRFGTAGKRWKQCL